MPKIQREKLLEHILSNTQSDKAIVNFEKRGGFLYCLTYDNNIKNVGYVKIGMTHRKLNETNENVLDRLKKRYHTYYPHVNILKFVKVSDCDKAEKTLFTCLKKYHLTNELYKYNKRAIEQSFNKVLNKYSDLSMILTRLDAVELTKLNQTLRNKFTINFNNF